MKKVISAVLTAAMVVGMGVSVLAATPSKTVADEVKASGSATVTGVLGIVSDVKVTAKEDTAQVEEVLQDITSDADLQKAAGASNGRCWTGTPRPLISTTAWMPSPRPSGFATA